MPSLLHEILIEMFRDRPEFAAELLSGPLGVTVPEFRTARLSASELTNVAPTEYRADAVVTLDGDRGPVLAVVVEVQLRVDPRKRRTWPAYVTTLHARLDCRVALLVLSPNQAVADWSGRPIVIGPPGTVVTPVAVGPRQIPVITDEDEARRNPELAVLSALAHSSRADPTPIFAAMFAGLDVIDHDQATLYTDLVFTVLPAAARKCLEVLLSTTAQRYQSDFAARYRAIGEAEGKAKGEANAVLAILDARGIQVSEDVRAEIADCEDLVRLEALIRRAATADKIEDLADLVGGL